MKDYFKNIDGLTIIQIIMVIGVIVLAYNNIDGWGWLLFVLALTL
jgi:hypothetical protein